MDMVAQFSPQALPAQTWVWRGFPIRYLQAGSEGPAVLLIHGFGASSSHWLKLMPQLATQARVYAIDLLGFGASAKPCPGAEVNYTFETWADQVAAFCQEVIAAPVYLVGNSIGCIVALQTAVQDPEWVRGVVMLNCSLRLLHERKRITLPWYRRWSAPVMQKLLSVKPLGHLFFRQLARPQVIRNILLEAYGEKQAVTDELVQLLLTPALDPGAADVFLAFVSYSQGPLPEDLLPQVRCPVLVAWGEADPWEPVDLGEELAVYDSVERFVRIEGAGHCPQDEKPEAVVALLQDWLDQHASVPATH
jgi:pimeloyl-ACP methyl ester carboxylesterase